MLYELSNNNITLKVSTLGAEMHSVFSKDLNKEILWQADKEVWARHAPVLFPIVGKLKDDTYTFNNQVYHLPQHGFARDKEFELVQQSNNELIFELRSNDDTKQVFPFDFTLKLIYRIHGQRITCHYVVYNTGTEDLYFSVGAHPGFVCPLFDGEAFSDYRIEFPQQETARRILLDNGLLTDATEAVIVDSAIPLHTSLFQKDAIVFNQLQSPSLTLTSTKYKLQFEWHNMPFFGIWSKKNNESFICLEPWAGIADQITSSGDLTHKLGIISLGANQQYNCGFSFSPAPADAE